MGTKKGGYGLLAAAVLGLAHEDIKVKPPKKKGATQTVIPANIKEWLFTWYFVKCKPEEYELFRGLAETCL